MIGAKAFQQHLARPLVAPVGVEDEEVAKAVPPRGVERFEADGNERFLP